MNEALLAEALAGLTGDPKTLSPKWLYDAQGSALFEEITGLPEYYLTRTETEILRGEAQRLAAFMPAGGALVEFGSGASVKTRILLDAAPHLGAYVPIDISAEFLAQNAADLGAAYPGLDIVPVVGDFLGPLALPPSVAGLPKVGFFPGSTIGNLPPDDARRLLRAARDWPDVRGFVLGVDLVKDEATLVAAYDDSRGVTARFIAGILTRLNREAGADFDLDAFAYEARWNSAAAYIDMRLVSERDQVVTLPGARIAFAAGEPVHVSASRKYTRDGLADLADLAGWTVDDVLTDSDHRVAVALLRI